jgi:hypothetical protein
MTIMEDNNFVRLLEETFLKANPHYRIRHQGHYEPAGIRLVQAYCGAKDPRTAELWMSKEWQLKGKKYQDRASGKEIPTRWDMTTDGELLCFQLSSSSYYLFEVEAMDEQQIAWAVSPPLSQAEMEKQRLDLVITLGRILVSKNMPFEKLSTGDLEMEHRVHLRRIQRATYKHPPHIPQYKDSDWLRDNVLSWGSATGWDITLDGRIACCRVGYEDYYVFLIEPLADQQISYYKKKFGVRDHIDDLSDAVKKYTDEQGIEMLEFLQLLLAELKKEEQE